MSLDGVITIDVGHGKVAVLDSADRVVADWKRWRISAEDDYAYAYDHGKKVYLHRALLGLGDGDGLEVDHIDRDPLNYRRSNLRVISRSGNLQNTASRRGAVSRFRGVDFHKPRGTWRARLQVNGKPLLLGYFPSEAEAAEAAQEGRQRHMPFAVD